MMSDSRIPTTEADLHAYADGQLAEPRRLQVEAYLAGRPEDAARVKAWMQDNEALRASLDPIIHEPIPVGIATRRGPSIPWRQFAAAASIAAASAGLGWVARDVLDARGGPRVASGLAIPRPTPAGFVQRAAIAHGVYSPEVRRPVEVGAENQDQLVAWLSKRLEAPMKPPHLEALGYELIGGRLLPGERGPAAQFMYHNGAGQRLTLYVGRETQPSSEKAFRFEKSGPVNVFYWIDGGFGYAISAGVEKGELQRVAAEVYRQLARN